MLRYKQPKKRRCLFLSITTLFLVSIITLSPALSNPSPLSTTRGFIALSDIHFDPFASCSASDHCPLATALIHHRWQQWDSLFQQYGMKTPTNNYKSDSNNALLLSALHDVKTRNLHPQFAIIVGDFLAHNMMKKYKKYSRDKQLKEYPAFINKVFLYFSSKIKQTFPNVPVYPVIGNNDSYHGDFYSTVNGPFYRFLTQNRAWGQFFLNQTNQIAFKRQFTVGGYYKITPPGSPDQRIIVLNTVLFATKAVGPTINKAAQAELTWLDNQLQLAKRHHRKVWLIFHIPYGVHSYSSIKKETAVMFWEKRDNQRFLALVKQYPHVIQAIITGHVHMDGFRYITLTNPHQIVIDSFVPSISPINGNNPGYQYYRYYPDNLALSNFTTYYLNIAAKTPQWKQAYNFNQLYQPHCQHCLLANGMKKLSELGKLSDVYRHYYPLGRKRQLIYYDQYWPYYWCSIRYPTPAGFNQCLQD